MFLNGFLSLTETDLQKPPAEVIDFYEVKAKQWARGASEDSRSALVHVAARHDLFSKFSQTKMEHGGKFGDGPEDLAAFEAWLVKMALSEKRQFHVSPVKKTEPDQPEGEAYQQYWKQFARPRDTSPAPSSDCAGSTEIGSNVTPSPAACKLTYEGQSVEPAFIECTFHAGVTPDPVPRLDVVSHSFVERGRPGILRKSTSMLTDGSGDVAMEKLGEQDGNGKVKRARA